MPPVLSTVFDAFPENAKLSFAKSEAEAESDYDALTRRGLHNLGFDDDASKTLVKDFISKTPEVKDVGDGRSGMSYADAIKIGLTYATPSDQAATMSLGEFLVKADAFSRYMGIAHRLNQGETG
jgi:hypothetical protein